MERLTADRVQAMTAEEVVRAFRVSPHGSDNLLVPNGKQLPPDVQAVIKARKFEILAYFARRREEKEARRREEEAARQAEREAIRRGEQPVQLVWRDGEYLTGWEAVGEAGPLLAELGLARYVSEWGYLVEDAVVKALGTEFRMPEAEALAQPRLDAARQREAQRKEKEAAAFARARQTGQPVEIDRRLGPCDGSVEECTMDTIIRLAMPDGTVRAKRIHHH